MKKVNVAIIGAGRAAQLHLDAYRRVYGIEVNVKYLFDTDAKKSVKIRKNYQINKIATDLDEIMKDDEIDAIDICTPPHTHKNLIIEALRHDKHVICEKPLYGFFGDGNTDGKIMYREVKKDLKELEDAIIKSNKQFFYAENFVYAPAIQKAAEIIKNKKSKILLAKGEESLAGSSSAVAGYWNKTGGGSLIRVGCHPLSAILYLKSINNSGISITDVKADISCVSKSLTKKQRRYLKTNAVDVEDTAIVTLSFSDDAKAIIIASDSRLGGSRNYIELYCNDAFLECNLTLNDIMKTYFADEEGLAAVELSEMLQTKTGWNRPFIEDEVIRGYVDEMQDFMECITYKHKPQSDFRLAKETIETIYQAYMQKSF